MRNTCTILLPQVPSAICRNKAHSFMPTLVIIKKLLTNRQQFILSFLNNVQTMLFLMTCSITMGKCFISSSCTFSAISSGVSLGSSLTENCAMCSPASSSGLTKWMVMPLTVSPAAFTASCT